MAEYTDKAILKSLMRKYGFHAPDMTINEFVDDECPTADAAPVVHGWWIEVSRIEHDYETEIEEKCSVCGRHVYRYDTQPQDNHCPSCSAKMYGEKTMAEYATNANPYWERITAISQRQRAKGIQTYGQGLEANRAAIETRLEYIEEELVDALMYIEWVKDGLKDG